MYQIAVLVTTHNGELWLEEQLLSIINQQNVNSVLWVSDDNSTDQSINVTSRLVESHKNIHLLNPQIKFGSAAQNFFRLIREVDLTKYDFIALSDQDDVWLPEKLTQAIDTIKDKNLDGYSSNVTAFWSDGKRKLISKAQPQTKFDFMFESAGPGCTFVMTQKMAIDLQKLLIKKEDNLRYIALHDWFIYAFARSKGYKWYIDPTPTLLYRQHADNVVGANIGTKAIKARLLKLTQGWYLQQILLIAKEMGYQHSLPIKKITRLSIWDRCYLAISSHQYRRRLRDRFAFAFFILFLAKKP